MSDDDLGDLDELDESGERDGVMTAEEAEELRRYEEEREARRVRRNALSGRITVWIVAAALAFLAYDSGGTALHRRDDGEPWLGHAALGCGCVVALLLLVAYVQRKRRR